jgi:membrane fusion protein, multidrug efflux system
MLFVGRVLSRLSEFPVLSVSFVSSGAFKPRLVSLVISLFVVSQGTLVMMRLTDFARPCLLLALMSLAGCQDDAVALQPSAPIKAIKYFTVETNHGSQERKLSGYLRATNLSELSFQVSGQVRSLKVKVGDRVKRGQPLAVLDAEVYQFRLRQAQAELASASALLKERKENYERQKLVFGKKFISKNTLEKAEADYQQADSSVSLAESKVSLAMRDLLNSEMKAPFDGVITRRDVEAFEEVAGAQSIMEIQGEMGLEVDFLVPSSLLSALPKGAKLNVRVPAISDEKLISEVSEVGVSADMRGAFPVRALVEAPSSSVRAGMVADVLISVNHETHSILLPESAVIVSADGKDKVFVYNSETQQVHSKIVQTSVVDVDTLKVTKGLKAGDVVCTAGVEFLREGQVVSLYSSNL